MKRKWVRLEVVIGRVCDLWDFQRETSIRQKMSKETSSWLGIQGVYGCEKDCGNKYSWWK